MKKLALLGFLLLFFATCAMADEISFHFIFGPVDSLTASPAFLHAGPAENVLVSDREKNEEFNEPGTFTATTGPSSSFMVIGTFVLATYKTAGPASILILAPDMHTVLISGSVENNATFLTSFPQGTGSFLGKFHVNFVNPSVLALFGLGPKFLSDGSFSIDFDHDNYDATDMTVTGDVSGGTVTFQTPTVPEPSSLGLLGMGLLTAVGVLKRRRA